MSFKEYFEKPKSINEGADKRVYMFLENLKESIKNSSIKDDDMKKILKSLKNVEKIIDKSFE